MIIIPRSWTTDPEVAFLLSAFGGTLIFLEGALFVSNAYGPFGALGLFCGGAIVAAAATFRSRITRRKELGGVVVVLSLISFLGLSGWFLGALLALIGGVLAIAARGGPFLNPRTSMFTA